MPPVEDGSGDAREVLISENPQVSASTSTECRQPKTEHLDNSTTRSLHERAEKLLKFGQMPLFAPARRDWTKAGLISMEFESCSFTWPPFGW